jgi:hypothetical protein
MTGAPISLGRRSFAAYGGTFTLKSTPCDSYDVDIVDEDGDECTIEAVDMCGDNSLWRSRTQLTGRARVSSSGPTNWA